MSIEDEARVAAILENAVDAIITIDTRGLIKAVNPATQRMFGYSPDELVGQNIKLLMPSPYQEEHDGYLQQYLATQKPKIIGIGREVVGKRKDGSEFPMHLAVSEFVSQQERLFTGIVRDITDLKAAEEKLRTLNDELERRVQDRTAELRDVQAELLRKERLATLGQVSGGIAHEIRNPLNAVKTSAYYLLNARNPSPAKRKEHLERIDRQVTMIDHVVTALSDVARMPKPNRVEQDVREHVRAVGSSVALGEAIRLELQLPDEEVRVRVDEFQFPIVLRNLVRNARDAMPEGGTLTMGVEVDEELVHIYVKDTGVGISSKDLSAVTEPFFSTKARGMGLGLAISKTIVDKNGGRLKIASELGSGSTFSIVFSKQNEH